MEPSYLVFFARDPVDDALAEAILASVRDLPGAGWFDDPGAPSPAERTTGGYVRCDDPRDDGARRLMAAARAVSAAHAIAIEVQWREELVAHIDRGTWRSADSISLP